MSKYKETIYALSSPAGKSAIAIIRVSGNNVLKIIKKLFPVSKKIIPNKTNLFLLKYKKKPIDQIVLIYFKKPHSYTGQEMIEINCHGSTAVIKKIFLILEDMGARQAEPGEFTKRALLNDKIDLVKTESIADLVNSETEKQRSLAVKNLSGELSSFTTSINKQISHVLANIEAIIDFSDEDLPKNILTSIKEQNKNIIKKINKELNRSELSKPIREGFNVSVIGKPNTGKSSFVNYISKKNISIVTNLPGTTTDAITSSLEIDGYKFTFVDTAGFRRHRNRIEEIGIKKTHEIILTSDLNLIFLEKNELKKYKNIKKKFFVRSKADKRRKITKEKDIFNISSVSGIGVQVLLKKIKENLLKNNRIEPILSRERHIFIMKNVLNTLNSIDFSENLDILAFKYRIALNQSLEINQKFDIEDILGIIFKDFCIGKWFHVKIW